MSRSFRLAPALAALLLAIPFPSGADTPDLAETLDRAMAAAEARLQAQDRAAADGLYRAALFQGFLLRASLDRVDRRIADAREAMASAAGLARDDPGALRALATAQLQVGDATAASATLARLPADGARDVETLRLTAKAHAASGRLEDAVRTLDDAAGRVADDPESAFLIAAEYLWLKRPEPAARLFARIAEARPIPQTHVLIGRAYRDAGEGERAAASLRKALAMDPAVRRAHYYLAMVTLADARLGRERYGQAIAELRAELALAPDDALASDQLGSALMDAERAAEALPAFETAVRADERHLYLLHLGRCLLALDRPRDAVAALRRALDRAGQQNASDPELEAIHYQLGLGLRRLGQAPEAAPHLAEARRLSSATASGPAHDGLPPESSVLTEMARTDRDALRARVQSILARASFNLGLIALQSPASGDAASFLEQAARIDPAFPRVQSALGVAYFNSGRYTQATTALAAAVAQEPQDGGLRRMLALSWLNTEAWDKAAPLLRDDPERERNASLQLAYGVALARTGRTSDAVGPLEAAARLAPGQADVQLELSKAYRLLGRTEEARRSYETFQRLKDKPPGSAE